MADKNVQITITAQDSASGPLGKIRQHFGEMNRATEQATRRFTEMNSALSSLGAALSVSAVALMTKAFIDAGMQVEQLQRQFAVFAGSANLGNRELIFIKDSAERLGLAMIPLSQSYGRFMNAVKGTSNEGQKGRDAFIGISEGIAAVGMTVDEQARAWAQLNQGIMKGKFEMEDLKTINEAGLPIFKLMADALGITTAELLKMQKEGKLLVEDVLPKLGKSMHEAYGVAASEAAGSAASEVNRFNNAMIETKAVAGAALMPVFTDIVRAMRPAFALLQEFIGGIQILAVKAAAIPDRVSASWQVIKSGKGLFSKEGLAMSGSLQAQITANEDAAIADIMKRMLSTGSDYTAAEKAHQASLKGTASATATTAAKKQAEGWTLAGDALYLYLQKVEEWEQRMVELVTAGSAQSASDAAVFKLMTFQPGDLTTDRYKVTPFSKYRFMTSDQYSIPQSSQTVPYDFDKFQKEFEAMSAMQEELYNKSPWGGLTNGIKEYSAEVTNMGKQIEYMTVTTMDRMSDSLAQFVTTGKANFRDLANAIIQDIIRIQARAAVSHLFSAAMGAISSVFGSTSVNGGSLSPYQGGGMYDGLRANGGPVYGGSSYLVGERGPELFTPGASGMITPNHAMGTSISVPVTIGNPRLASDLRMEIEDAVNRVLRRAA